VDVRNQYNSYSVKCFLSLMEVAQTCKSIGRKDATVFRRSLLETRHLLAAQSVLKLLCNKGIDESKRKKFTHGNS
jgi:hypothetical protein